MKRYVGAVLVLLVGLLAGCRSTAGSGTPPLFSGRVVNQQGDEFLPNIDRLWDIANTIRLVELKAAPLYGIGTDDSHNYHGKPDGARPGRGWTMVRSTHLTPEYILKAIRAGDCYASSGVTLVDVRYDRQSRMLSLAIEPATGVTYVTHFIGTRRGADTSSQPTLDAAGKPQRPTVTKQYEVTVARDIGLWTGHDLATGDKYGCYSVWQWG